MAHFTEEESNAARHYDKGAFDAEQVRLPRDCPVELGMTLRWLGRVAKANDVALEIGERASASRIISYSWAEGYRRVVI
jgi:hypothetical protein